METTAARNSWGLSGPAVDLRRPPQPARPLHVPALPQQLTLDLARTALVVVDLQNDFGSPDGWLASIGVDVSPVAALVPRVAAATAALRAHGVPVVWLNWGNRPDRANLPPGVRHVYDPDGDSTGIGDPLPNGARVLQAGSWAAAPLDGLAPEPGDVRVDKYRMSGFVDTPLDSVLRNLRVDTLLFAGVNVDQCVLATLTEAAGLGYDVVLVEELCATTSPSFCTEATLYNVRQCFGFTVRDPDLRAALAGPDPVDEETP
ncbi:isochorismatase family protein [Modestobacter sp. I12A-02628]|uniref:Isochorismatase family protein n=1 Tax=Goekera deserti TaxID=2497753 RepID=A0A7K3WCT2_9ACTN|nr:isochorismatase family cysteine hydrolase [Goekera deserti]MPQ97388.1 isochorismatase family protein [Goekera deserti]NDI48011.1 isochorismatase family protein [Goekera deserti]NEL53759.1 isochorismatase family protein [Goekera deserti]